MPDFSWRPANDATSADLEAVFDAGGARKCRCQALKVPGWIWRDTTQEERDAALLEQAGCGTSGPTSGLVGYVDGEPAGWVAVEPRENYPRIWARQKSWMRMDRDLEGVWSPCQCIARPDGTFLPAGTGLWLMTGDVGALDDGRSGWISHPNQPLEGVMAKNLLRSPTLDLAGGTGPHPAPPVVRVGGVAAILGGLVMVVHEVWDARIPGIQEGSVLFSALHTIWVVLMFVAILGLAAIQRPAFGRLGRIATVVALVGTGGLAVLALIETIGLVGSPAESTGDPALPVLVLMFAVFGCYVAGLLLFGVATFRARVLPPSAGALLVVTVLLKMFASDVVPGTLALLGAAFVWLGVAVLRASRNHRTSPINESANA